MDEETRQQFAAIRAILAQTAQMQADNALQIRENSLGIRDNKEAISQLTYLFEELRQSLIEERRLISDLRSEVARHADSG